MNTTKKTLFLLLLIIGGIIMFNRMHKIDAYEGGNPKIDVKEYFTGNIKAWGVIQDWRGKVISRFDIDMVGSWDGDLGTLAEEFIFYDGSSLQRSWSIKKVAKNEYEGTAGDVQGIAIGMQNGNAVNWRYNMEIPVGDTKYKFAMNDWMWQMNDGVLINRTAMKKFGITVAELTIFMQKQQ